ncbi:substrate-binding domain-containing protein [Aestuariispira insulae]|uniref:Monosaccharide ABC transporter substrate-binding protein (CUT2 family) n=1 Tax=Aestuariispira insulae TaxID=1461337 RepID=A0A3D9HI46_9PROT|nr:substrate-binding domain-containing protein [Aestuariispira insulae]RED49189.1 monosaccharide ABC transporter substrate-binding protein (CUT2 family) [Aestuariispira insulae]
MVFKKLVHGLLILVALGLSGCDDSSTEEETQQQSKAEKETRIALVMKTLTNPFFVSMEKGARKAEKELGIELIVRTAAEETSANQQIRIVEQLVDDGNIQAIVIAPADSVGLIPALKKAQDEGIIVVNLDNRLDQAFSQKAGLENVPFISIDNKLSAYRSAKFIADQATGPSKAVIIEGIREAQNALDRRDGATQAFEENSNIDVVASESARWMIDEANELIKTLFENEPDITLIFCANDMMALGVIEYLQSTNRKDVLVAGFDAIEEARQAIKQGSLQVTIDQQPALQGYMGIKAAHDLINGQDVDALIMLDGLLVSN